MTDDMQAMRDDIAFLREMAEGGSGVRQGGVVLMAAGVFYACASLMQWAALTGRVNGAVSNWTWLGATVAFLIVLAIAKGRWRSQGVGVASYAWQGVGIGCFFIFVALAVATWRTQSPVLIGFAPSIIFILYGAAWMVAAASSRIAWLHVTAWGSFLGAVVVAWFIGRAECYLIYAAGLMLLTFLPGLIFTLSARGRG